jgi:hypothetical protein
MSDGSIFIGSCQVCENIPCTCKHVPHVPFNRPECDEVREAALKLMLTIDLCEAVSSTIHAANERLRKALAGA